ncbi:MAG: DNA polymerase III subunit chi [Desulfuromonas sp.]|nr:MAG: DNA polymerase III subunit chi [Desulfuromonas sp.]
MPPVVEFIKLKKPEKAKHLCQLAEEFFSGHKRVLILVEDDNQALTLDRFMWTWNKGSFLPHVWDNGAVECHEEAIAIGTQERNSNGATVLIAGRACRVEFMRQFKHVIDFAETYDEALTDAARDRFKAWREIGCEPRMR